jgi:hypothetical protein
MSENNGDPVGDFQRWLMKQGAKGMAKQVADKVRTTVGVAPDPKADVWETATTEPLGEEPPECKWCPICRAADPDPVCQRLVHVTENRVPRLGLPDRLEQG